MWYHINEFVYYKYILNKYNIFGEKIWKKRKIIIEILMMK